MDGTSLCGLTHSQAVATLKATINLDQVVLGIMEGPETSYGNLSDFIYFFWKAVVIWGLIFEAFYSPEQIQYNFSRYLHTYLPIPENL